MTCTDHITTGILASLLFCSAGAAQTDSSPTERQDRLEDEIADLQQQLTEIRERLDSSSANPPTEATDRSQVQITPPWSRERLGPAALRGVYDKPFLLDLGKRAYIGGYSELEFHGFENPILGIPRGFRVHRTNLFAFADISDSVRFVSEIEFENEEPGEDLEVKIEAAFVDWIIAREFVIRAGALLAPVGRINVNHDGPTRELTQRPLVSTFVIPTTLTDPGIGFHGTFSGSDHTSFGYEVYATNGFRLLDDNGKLAAPIAEIEQLLREGSPSNGGDTNKSVATTGRLSVTHSRQTLPQSGNEDRAQTEVRAIEAGISWHIGNYDERNQNLLTLLAGDFATVIGPLTFEGEVAWAGFERDTFSRTSGIPDDFSGYYLQGSWSFLPRILKEKAPRVFGNEGSAFTVVARYDSIRLDSDRVSSLETGINFRPVSDTVFKLSYRFGWHEFNRIDVPALSDADDSGLTFSVSTYF